MRQLRNTFADPPPRREASHQVFANISVFPIEHCQPSARSLVNHLIERAWSCHRMERSIRYILVVAGDTDGPEPTFADGAADDGN